MLSLYADTPSWLHRVPAGLKLAALAGGGLALALTTDALALAVAAVAALGLLASLGPAGRGARRPMTVTLVVAALLVGLHALLGTVPLGLVAALRLVCTTALGLALTLTTRPADLVEVIERLLQPLRHLGLDPSRFALHLALMLRYTEHFFARWQQLDEAHRLRTGRPGGLRLLAPLTLQMLLAARRVADTLHVRLGR
ncbi:energy-coupling factor transporter transmembrane component T [Leptothrix discophora]|uniref:Energy-coupling factor transporter transmembrane component T n=1 Tax=Leptothrix discophora TaxID=89 RepID=A0ABT9G807_LEPDI|nr:energy-coupling factor transporter transmembrane component T [Leptothrix discophora]MDP4302616.1 energy-coupling factor transporter transmembrane component T [Leptothrix discophora]